MLPGSSERLNVPYYTAQGLRGQVNKFKRVNGNDHGRANYHMPRGSRERVG